MKLFVSSIEPSANLLAEHVIELLKDLKIKKLDMDTSALCKIGVWEVLTNLPEVLQTIARAKKILRDQAPDALLTVDAPDFHFILGSHFKKLFPDRPWIHYVAPSVWAWRSGRAKKWAKKTDHILTLFPFEPRFFEKYNGKATCIGHIAQFTTTNSFKNFFLLLPGSRENEIKSLLPIFLDVANNFPDEKLILTTERQLPLVREITKDRYPITTDKQYALSNAKFAVVASGTMTLELAFADIPMVICYIVNPITYLLGKILLQTKFIGLPNILAQDSIVPELLQGDVNPDNITKHLHRILKNKPQYKLFKNHTSPSISAKNIILDILNKN